MSKQCIVNVKISVVLVIALGLIIMSWVKVSTSAAAQANSSQNSAIQEEKPFDQKQVLAELQKKIAGQEDKPAGEVFKNIQVPLFKRLPAKYFLGAMEFLFSKSIGVDCRHCHVVEQWEKDDKPTKQIGREMYALMLSIQGSLKKVSNLKSANPVVTCYTCHRGQTKPEIELPELKKK
ncbi:MAG: photosynthetic reaction center cytochrome c subunit family protein [Nitrososphaera sp.]|nr:photosynthetic reaction center cytochrome c subunit family protein [Nitrososphaera sp.]